MTDILNRPILIGDSILVCTMYGINVEIVKRVIGENMVVIGEGNSTQNLNVRKCVVITEQLQSNKDKYPENFI